MRAGHRNAILIGVVCFAIGNLVTSVLKDLSVIAFVYGGLVGFATNVVCLTAAHMIVLCFEVKYVSLSTGIGLSGIGVGLIVNSPAISWIFAHLGWRQSLRVIAAAYGVMGLLCSYVFYLPPNFKPKDGDESITQNDFKGKDKVSAIKRIKSLVKCPLFWSTQVVFFTCTLVVQFLYISVGNYMRILGANDGQITLTSTLMGVGDLLGRLLMAFATDNICISRTLVYAFNSFFGGMLMLFLLISKSTFVTSLIIAGLSIPRGTVYSMILPVAVELFGKKSAVEAISIAYFVTGFANLAGPLLSDTPFDKSGSYSLTIYISGILFVFAGFLMTCVELTRRRRNHRKAEDKKKSDQNAFKIPSSYLAPNFGNSQKQKSHRNV
ncbi:monocarboxylate transporter 13-like [Anneissia japonica]|uniref:monocarboxylate transporter 13-like n=1 Tax=Anneissia japonica TaxID=1529436 RepID=UPI001425ABC8|nr:monocarboxylate transporter 13-like [Anneissia japonica]